MTIALGMLASNGLVIAADMQETRGYTKIKRSKVAMVLTAHSLDTRETTARCCIVTGSGTAHHLNTVGHQLMQCVANGEDKADDVLISELTSIVAEYYCAHIAPFSNFPADIRPDFEIILGMGRRLFVSQYDVLSEVTTPFVTVGVGATVADPLLTYFYQSPRPDVRSAVLLSAYAIFRAKDSVEGYGKTTEIVGIIDGNIFQIPREDVHDLERAISNYSTNVEPAMLRSLTGIATAKQRKESSTATAKLRKIIGDISARLKLGYCQQESD